MRSNNEYIPLTPKQIRFAQEYVVDLNAKQAAIRTGHKASGATRAGYTYLNTPYVKEYIDRLLAKKAKEVEITHTDIIQELIKIGFSNLQDYLTADNQPADLQQVGNDKTACLSGIKINTTTKGDIITSRVVFKLHDKIRALEKLSRRLGFTKPNGALKKQRVSIMCLGDGTEVEI